MGAFGRTLVRGLGAAMQGYGTTLLEQDAEQTKQREQAALLLREQALASYKEQLQRGTLAVTAAANVATHRANAQTDSDIAMNELPAKTDAKIRADKADKEAAFQVWLQQQPIELRNKMTLQQAHDKYDMAKEQFVQGQTNARSAADRQARIDTSPIMTVENTNGEPTALFAPGATTRSVTARHGQKLGTDASADDGSDSIAALTGKKPAARSGGSAAPAAAPPAAKYSFDQLYTAAMNSPSMAGKSGAEIRAEAIRVAKANGIPAPDS